MKKPVLSNKDRLMENGAFSIYVSPIKASNQLCSYHTTDICFVLGIFVMVVLSQCGSYKNFNVNITEN